MTKYTAIAKPSEMLSRVEAHRVHLPANIHSASPNEVTLAEFPCASSCAAGAVINVVVEELIPESHQAGNVDLVTASFVVGFSTMMVLDVAPG